MAHFTKSGQRLYTAEQVQAYFNNSFWSEYNQTQEDDDKTGGGARFSGFAQFHLGETRISCGAWFKHLTAEELNELAKKKDKPVSKCRSYRGGHTNNRDLAKQNVDFLERLDAMEVGDGSTSHDQAFDNRELAA